MRSWDSFFHPDDFKEIFDVPTKNYIVNHANEILFNELKKLPRVYKKNVNTEDVWYGNRRYSSTHEGVVFGEKGLK